MVDLLKQDLQVEIIPGNTVQMQIETMKTFHEDMRRLPDYCYQAGI